VLGGEALRRRRDCGLRFGPGAGAPDLGGAVQPSRLLQEAPEVLAGGRVRLAREVLWRAFCDHEPALVATLGAEVDEPVGGLQHIQVVLDDDHGIAVIDQPVQHLQQSLHVGVVEAGGRLVEEVQGTAGVAARKLGRELHALRLTARQLRRRLSEPDVAEADVVQRAQLDLDPRHVLENLEGLVDRKLENVGDRMAAELDLLHLARVARPVTHLTRHVHVG